MDAHPAPPPDALTPAGAGRTALRMERVIAAPPVRVWAALTEPELIAGWFPARVTPAPTPGAALVFHFSAAEGPDTTGTVTELAEPRLLAFTWGEDELRFASAPAGDDTLLTLTHTFGDHYGAASFAAGWDRCLAALDALLTGRESVVMDPSGELHERYVRLLGLDGGTVTTGDGGPSIRYERQLVRPAETVWAALSGSATPLLGGPPPPGFTAPGERPGPITALRPPRLLAYERPPAGAVRWRLGTGTGHGARLVLTADLAPEESAPDVLAAWRNRIEALAAELPDR
ncbi:SRPBCC family protein [Streptomyces yaizuensis]|uniref:SRPBCC domain-containing protein n=1 Tax=Streptomyces yaizuensis TaxID=2989713 RepID=A0ABQ5NWP8_9ACTN|nr:SRPBCC family protein [Streptomyces sp. YSPA8]GLF94798.1 SRPBCC domain-containing protein [Streptomyces sp. YSPA8]